MIKDNSLDSHINEIEDAISEEDVMDLRDKLNKISVKKLKKKSRELSKRLRDENISYKILKTKASNYFGSWILGPAMEKYYKKFKNYDPENSLGEKYYSHNARMRLYFKE